MGIGSVIVDKRFLIPLVWVATAVGLSIFVPPVDPRVNQPSGFLPDDSPYARAAAAMSESFPENSGLSQGVIVFERRSGELTAADLAAIERIAQRIAQPSSIADHSDLAGIRIRSPRSFLTHPNPMKSDLTDTGQGALVVIGIPANFITLRSDRIVDHIYSVLSQEGVPYGLEVSVTGSSGFGHDYADAAESSHARTLRVTLVAVIVILLLVYRSPVAALVPLTAISLAAFVAMKILGVAQHFGMQVGTAERIFVIVLLYGAGTDYSLFFISRFREFTEEGLTTTSAASRALGATFPAIFASAGTDTAGLMMLCFAEYGIFRTTGPAVGVALVVALLGSVTLVPSLVAIGGDRLFWPGKLIPGSVRTWGLGKRRFWPSVARMVTGRPASVLVVVLVLLSIPAWRGLRLRWVYDTLTELDVRGDEVIGNAAGGIEAVRRHWPVGQIAPVQVLIKTKGPRTYDQWRSAVDRLTAGLEALPGTVSVRSLTRPLGAKGEKLTDVIVSKLAADEITAEYLGKDMTATRLAVILEDPAFSLSAMESVALIRGVVEASLTTGILGPGGGTEVHIAGGTAEMIDTRAVTQSDFIRVAALSLGVIFLMVLGLLRDAVLSAFMVASTVLSYFAVLGISYWVFSGLLGSEGLDWKVEVFLFVVMVAVGVDYNIFLASRLAQEARRLSPKLATCRAIIHTGPVISSCGLIMAATLGSLMAGELTLLRQLGFALALGMLIDTFLVRPLLLPAFAALTRRTGKGLDLGR